MRTLIYLIEGQGPDFEWLERAYAADNFWEELFKNIDVSTTVLPSGTKLFHGTIPNWNPEDINGPAWFGDFKVAKTYATSVFYYEKPIIHEYATTRPYNLLVVEGEIGRRMMALLDGGEIIMTDLAQTVLENGFEGWQDGEKGSHHEIMLGDTSGLRYVASHEANIDYPLNERYENTIVGIRGKQTEVFRNPSRKEWRQISGEYQLIRGFIVGDDLLVWAAFDAVHQNIREGLKLPNTAIPVTIEGEYRGSIYINVTDNARPPVLHNPEIRSMILDCDFLNAFSDIEIGFFDEAIYGDWEDLD